MRRLLFVLVAGIAIGGHMPCLGQKLTVEADMAWARLMPYFNPPPELAGDFGKYKSPLIFKGGRKVGTAADWQKRRDEILEYWHKEMGEWPPVIEKPKLEILGSVIREGFTQHRVRVEISAGQTALGYLLVPPGKGPFPAVFVPYYDAETSVGLTTNKLRDFAYQLTKRGFVSLSIGSPGGDARKPDLGEAHCQPLSYLAYIAANCFNALANRPDVDAKRIGVVGHSYGGKWAMFASCLYDKYACAVWSDPGIVFDEPRGNVNYWEPWYLGWEKDRTRKPGLISSDSPRTGAYKDIFEHGHDLHELHALMAPRPFMVSGGSEDTVTRWQPLNYAIEVNKLLGYSNRVGMTNRPTHPPTVESNMHIYAFFEYFLKYAK